MTDNETETITFNGAEIRFDVHCPSGMIYYDPNGFTINWVQHGDAEND